MHNMANTATHTVLLQFELLYNGFINIVNAFMPIERVLRKTYAVASAASLGLLAVDVDGTAAIGSTVDCCCWLVLVPGSEDVEGKMGSPLLSG